MAAAKISIAQVQKYLEKEHALVVGKELIEKSVPPPGVSLDVLRRLRERLDKYRMQLS
jgi:hypothetical protein